MFGSTQPNAFGAKRARLNRVTGNVRVRAHANLAERLCPAHQFLQVSIIGGGLHRIQLALDNPAGGGIERDPVAFMKTWPLCPHLASSFFYFDIAAPRHTAFSHSASNDSRVTSHASAGS